MGYKLCEFCKNRARDTPLWGVYIPHFAQIKIKISVLGLAPLSLHRWGWNLRAGGDRRGQVPSCTPNFTPIDATCRPAGRKTSKCCR